MNVSNSLFGNVSSALLDNVASTAATTSAATASSIPPPLKSSSSASTPGQFFSEMQQLSQSNPSEFKTVAAEVAKTFQSAASQATGSQAQLLGKLASQFTQAAQTGTMPSPQGSSSANQAPQGAWSPGGSSGAHHHRHHGAGGSLGQSGVQATFQSAMSIVEQATGGTSSSGTSAST